MTRRILQLIFSIFGAISLIRVFVSHGDWTIERWLSEVIRIYSDFLGNYFGWVLVFFGWAAQLIDSVFEIELVVYPYSIDILLFLMSYIGIFSSVTWSSSGLRRLAVIRMIAGIVISVVVAFVFGSVEAEGIWEVILLPTAFVSGVSFFLLFNGVRAAIFYPPPGVTSLHVSILMRTKQFREWVLMGGGFILLLWLGFTLGWFDVWNIGLSLSVLWMMVLYLLLGMYRFYLGPFTGEYDSRDGTWWGKRWRSGAGEVGFLMSLTVVWSVGALLTGIG